MADFDPTRPFLASVAREHLTSWALRAPTYRQLFRGVWIGGTVQVTDTVRARAALLISQEGSYLSHHTAARLAGGIVPDDCTIHVTSPSTRSKQPGITGHRARTETAHGTFRGLDMTTPLQTFAQLGALSLVDLVVLGDSLVKKGRFTTDELVRHLASAKGRHSVHLRRAASYVRSEVDSPMESRLRMLIVLAGLPEPTINHRIHNRSGDLLHRFDLSYPEYRLIVEYDGRQHTEMGQWGTDISRREWMDRNQWRLVVVRAEGVYSKPATTLQRITTTMHEVGMPVPPLCDEWRLHFPSKPGDLATII